MSVTYSILKGELTESTRKSDIYSVLQDLPNNSQKLISPRDVRDAFLSTWANSSFKLTSTGNVEYIGLDSINPDDRDIKRKILLGKRSVGTLNIMSDSLINTSDSDIFFYNTKPDNISQDSTKISFLAGTASNLFNNAPFIESKKVNNLLEFNIENPQSSINILSGENNRVTINNISFPTPSETQNQIGDDKILKYKGIYPFGNLEWTDLTVDNTLIGQPGSSTEIVGLTVSLNGFPLEFIDDRVVPIKIGNIEAGMSFSENSFNGQNWPISEVLREVIYPFIEPEINLEVINDLTGTKYAEIGTSIDISFSYSITTYARENSENISQSFLRDSATGSVTWNVISGSITGPLIDEPGTTFNFSNNLSNVNGNNVIDEELYYSVFVSDLNPSSSLDPNNSITGFSYSQTESIKFIQPIMYGFLENEYPFTTSGLNGLFNDGDIIKIIEPVEEDKTFEVLLSTQIPSYLYFTHPNIEQLKKVKDPNGYIIYDSDNQSISSFTFSSILTPQSPLNYYGNYRVYRTNNKVVYNGTGKFKFEF